MKDEVAALKLSAGLALAMGLLGFAFAMWSESQAILLDGFFSLINFVAGLLTIRVARLVQQPPDEQLHFGYAQFEPFLNALKGLTTLLVAAFAGVSSVVTILHGGRPMEPGPAVVYAVLAMVGGLGVAFLQRRAASRMSSPLLDVEAKNWLIDGLMSGAVALAFVGAIFLGRSGAAHLVPYVDPVLVVLLVLVMIKVPFGIVRSSIRELLGFAPEADLQKEVRRRVDGALHDFPVLNRYVRLHRIGRYLYIMNQIVVTPEYRLERVHALDETRGRIRKALEGVHPSLVIDVLFTEDEQWVE